MKRIKSVLAVAAVMVMMVVSALPAAAAQSSNGPICQSFLTEGELGYYPNTSSRGPGYYAPVYGWHMWCQSSVWGWYVQR